MTNPEGPGDVRQGFPSFPPCQRLALLIPIERRPAHMNPSFFRSAAPPADYLRGLAVAELSMETAA
jgi:hypothetical protein